MRTTVVLAVLGGPACVTVVDDTGAGSVADGQPGDDADGDGDGDAGDGGGTDDGGAGDGDEGGDGGGDGAGDDGDPGPPCEATDARIARGGWWFGECIGQCVAEITLDPATGAAYYTVRDWDGTSYAANLGTLTARGLEQNCALAAVLEDTSLEATYGCPDCDDGGGFRISLYDDEAITDHEMEYGDPPPALGDAHAWLSGLMTAMHTCKETATVVPDASCAPAS